MLEMLKVFAGNIVAGVGFTIYAFNTGQLNEPVLVRTEGRVALAAGPGIQDAQSTPPSGGIGTRIYGQFTVAWAWV